MNLITERWIPVTFLEGAARMVGLDELFQRGAEIRDLAVMPHERIALLRLLLCITHAALDGPEDYRSWKECRAMIPAFTGKYLRKWNSAFELFGAGPRFLQVSDLTPSNADGEGTMATKLDLALATGNNATIFDNAGGNHPARLPERLALTLLGFQCFSPCGRIAVAKWHGKDTPGRGSSTQAPCGASSMLHCFLLGRSLLDTIHLNLLDRERVADFYGSDAWGRPIWEMPVETLSAKAEIHNATKTYLGRLVPLSRLVRLFESGERVTLGNGLEYPTYPGFREPSATLVVRDEKATVLSANLERSLWRQLPAITVKRHAAKSPNSGPETLTNIPDESGATLWLGAMLFDKGKIEDTVEAVYRVPAGMFQDTGHQVFEAGIALATNWENALCACVRSYAESLKLQPAPYERARRHYWTAVEQHVPVLLDLTNTPALTADITATSWGRAVRAAAYDAYEFACQSQTPRQIEAFAKGRQRLFLRRLASPNERKETSQSKNTQQSSKS